MHIVKVSQEGRIVIPAGFREKYNIHQGDELIFEDRGGELVLSSRRQRLSSIQEECFHLLTKESGSLADELMAERRLEARKEFNKKQGRTRNAKPKSRS